MGYKAIDGIVETVENARGILISEPTGKIVSQQFLGGFRKDLESTSDTVRLKYGLSLPGAVLAWKQFLDEAPQSDIVEEYIAQHPLYIPFKEDLFGVTCEMDGVRYVFNDLYF